MEQPDNSNDESVLSPLNRVAGRKFASQSQPEVDRCSKKMKTKKENLSIGFHRKELTLRIPIPPNSDDPNRFSVVSAAVGAETNRPSRPPGQRINKSTVINISSPTIQNAFKLYVNVDSQSLPVFRNAEAPPNDLMRSGSRDASLGARSSTGSVRIRRVYVNGAYVGEDSSTSTVSAGVSQPQLEQAAAARDQQVGGGFYGRDMLLRPERMPPNGTLVVVPVPPEDYRDVVKPLSLRNGNVEKKIRQVFQDLTIELTHSPMAQDVGIRIFQKNDTDKTENAIRVNGRTQDKHLGMNWQDFKFVHLRLHFFKPDDSDVTLGKRVNISRVFEVTAQSPCGVDLCPCNNGDSMCFRGVLCQFSALEEYFCQTMVLSASGHLKMPVLNIILSATFYTEEEKDIRVILKELREKSLTDMGKKVLGQGLHSDFLIRCEGKTFPCHKSILSAHSDVFAAMFMAPMAEVASSELMVDDMSWQGVDAFLKFLYHGEIDSAVVSSTIAFELLKAGHKYQIQALEKIGKELLYLEKDYKFEMSTALDMFTFCGHIDKLKPLQDKAVRVMKSRPDELIDSDEFEELLAYSSDVAKELFKRVCRI